ncbi:MAG: sporulation protein Cse60 [Bacillota bacterium]
MQVKVLTGCDEAARLEQQINEWIESNRDKEILDVKFSYAAISRFGAEGWYSAMILYRESED